jgi:hypothetical protein
MVRRMQVRKWKDPPPTPLAFSIRDPLVSLRQSHHPPLGIRIWESCQERESRSLYFLRRGGDEARGEATRWVLARQPSTGKEGEVVAAAAGECEGAHASLPLPRAFLGGGRWGRGVAAAATTVSSREAASTGRSREVATTGRNQEAPKDSTSSGRFRGRRKATRLSTGSIVRGTHWHRRCLLPKAERRHQRRRRCPGSWRSHITILEYTCHRTLDGGALSCNVFNFYSVDLAALWRCRIYRIHIFFDPPSRSPDPPASNWGYWTTFANLICSFSLALPLKNDSVGHEVHGS